MSKWNVIEIEYGSHDVERITDTLDTYAKAMGRAARRAVERVALKQADGRTVIAYEVREC
jgi:hypothetical protein